MKNLVSSICLFSFILFASAQKKSSYANLLNSTKEIVIADSLYATFSSLEKMPIDDEMTKVFNQKVDPLNNWPGFHYYLAGKITSNKNFDVLLIPAERKTNDTTKTHYVFIMTMTKEGKPIENGLAFHMVLFNDKPAGASRLDSWLFNQFKRKSRMVKMQKDGWISIENSECEIDISGKFKCHTIM
jgi:hypothetical protein